MTNRELLRRLRDGDLAMRDILVVQNKGLVHTVANRYAQVHNPYFGLEDAVQEGMIGLLKAIDTYDESRQKTAFSTYACVCIRNEILMAYRKVNRKNRLECDEELAIPVKSMEDFAMNIWDYVADTSIHFEKDIEDKADVCTAIYMIGRLEPCDRRIIMCHVLNHDTKTQREMSRELGMSQPGFSKGLNRARRRLQVLCGGGN